MMTHSDNKLHPWKIVKQWYATDLGKELFKVEKACIDHQLEQFFGYNLLQLGCFDHQTKNLFEKSKVSNQFVVESSAIIENKDSHCTIASCFDNLAIKSNSVDVIVLPHTLEFEKYPHQILREVERVLMPEGKAIFILFNPYSLWGLWHKYWQIKVNSQDQIQSPLPSIGHLISQRRLKDWLKLLGFDIQLVQGYFFRPPLKNLKLLKKLAFMEKIADASKLIPPGAYMIVASKRISTLTPLRQPWRLSRTVMGSKLPEQAGSGFKANEIKSQNKSKKLK